MSNKGLRVIWFRLNTGKNKGFHLSYPISMNVFQELLDSFLDLIAFACFFVTKNSKSSSHMSIHDVKELVQMLMALFGSITEDGPYDLVNVATDDVKVSIKIR